MKQVLLKTIIIVVSKLTRSRVLQGRVSQDPKGQGWSKKKLCGARQRPHPLDPSCPIVIPTLRTTKYSLPKL